MAVKPDTICGFDTPVSVGVPVGGVPAGTTSIFHRVSVPEAVQLNSTDVYDNTVAFKLIGLKQVGASSKPTSSIKISL